MSVAVNPFAVVVTPPSVENFGDGELTGIRLPVSKPGVVIGYGKQRLFWEVPSITPATDTKRPAKPVNKRIVYVNGMNTLRANHAYSAKLLSIVSGAGVVGIYSESNDGESRLPAQLNIGRDLVESLDLYLGGPGNAATETMTKVVCDACESGVFLNSVSTSQGSIVVSAAISFAIFRLLNRYSKKISELQSQIYDLLINNNSGGGLRLGGGSRYENEQKINLLRNEYENEVNRVLPKVQERLNRYVSVHTFGGAIKSYPKGPIYRHVVNSFDDIGNQVGLGVNGQNVTAISRDSGSEGTGIVEDHSFDDLYIQSSRYFVDWTGRKVDSNYVPLNMNIIR